MALPINIEELLSGRTVEWDRIEFREGWNPQRTLRTICAFANDFNNWGGGYIIIGVKTKNGVPVLPPKGLDISKLDKIQQELNQLCRKIIPDYFPITEPVDYQNKKILILWCPGGSNRPYKAPESLGKKSQYVYFIKRYSSTVRPTAEEEKDLLSMANRIPFDDQINHQAQLSDLDLSSIRAFLHEIKSDLEQYIPEISVGDLTRRMNIAEGPDENLIPKNVGLLFFAKDTQHFFPQAKIEIITFDDESGTNYLEKIFSGQLHIQLQNALSYLQGNIIQERVAKIKNKAEADRYFNYPYEAIEEALCNAVYHRGYDNDSTIEVRIFPSRIDIISYPGPLPPLNRDKLKKLQFDVRRYRNRRIGEFLKELHLTEGRATGIPSILDALKNNGSPRPVFDTDDERSYFKATLKVHPEFLVKDQKKHSKTEVGPSRDQVGTKLGLSWDQAVSKLKLSKRDVERILSKCRNPQPTTSLMNLFKLKNRTKFKRKYINPLIKLGLLSMTIPDTPKSPNQAYQTTTRGDALLKKDK